jgi:hypothetical protein
MLILRGAKAVVCLHYETQQTTPKGETLVKIRCFLHRSYALIAATIVTSIVRDCSSITRRSKQKYNI